MYDWYERNARESLYDECYGKSVLSCYLELSPSSRSFLRYQFRRVKPSWLQRREYRDEYIRRFWIDEQYSHWEEASEAKASWNRKD